MAMSICHPDFTFSTTMRLAYWAFGEMSKTIAYIAMTFGTDIHFPFRMSFSDIGDPLIFHLAPLSKFHLLQYFCLLPNASKNETHTHQPQINFVFHVN